MTEKMIDLHADSTDAELRAAAEHYAAGTGEAPDVVLARLQDAQWELRDIADTYPDLPAPLLSVTPWSDDEDLAETAAELAAAYAGADRGVLAGMLRDLRWHLREAVTAEAETVLTDEELAVQSVLDLGVAELIWHATTDEELAALVIAAEAGAGGPLFGLREELRNLRDLRWELREAMAEAEEDTRRVFVGGADGDPIRVCIPDPVSGPAADDGFVQPGETEMSAEGRRAIDAIKARLRAEGHVTGLSSNEDLEFLVAGAEATVGHALPGLDVELAALRRQLLAAIPIEDL